MLKLRKRHDLWHLDIHYRDPETGERKRSRRSTGLKATRQNRREATQMGHALLQQLETRLSEPAPLLSELTVEEFAGVWFRTHCQVRLKPMTCRRYWQILARHIIPAMGALPLRSVRRIHIERFIAAKQARYAAKTVNHYLGVLTVLFNAAVDWDELERSPCKGVKRLREDPPKTSFWTFEESSVFLAVAAEREPEWHLVFLMALRTGLRQGELFALRWSDVDFECGTLHVCRSVSRGFETSPKSNRTRRVPMTRALESVLRPRAGKPDVRVFQHVGEKPPTNSRARRALQRLAKAAGVKQIRFHDLRHTYASHLVMRGVPLNTVRELMGHSDMKMTLRYAHLAPDVKWSAVQCLDEPSRHVYRHASAGEPALTLVSGE
jgi:integrase